MTPANFSQYFVTSIENITNAYRMIASLAIIFRVLLLFRIRITLVFTIIVRVIVFFLFFSIICIIITAWSILFFSLSSIVGCCCFLTNKIMNIFLWLNNSFKKAPLKNDYIWNNSSLTLGNWSRRLDELVGLCWAA
jgi:hypothetical protein